MTRRLLTAAAMTCLVAACGFTLGMMLILAQRIIEGLW